MSVAPVRLIRPDRPGPAVVARQPRVLLPCRAADRAVDDARLRGRPPRSPRPNRGEPPVSGVPMKTSARADSGSPRPRSLLVGQVEHDRPLVAVDPEVVGADPVRAGAAPIAGCRRRPGPRPRRRRPRGHRASWWHGPGQDAGEVGDHDPGQRSLRFVGHACSFSRSIPCCLARYAAARERSAAPRYTDTCPPICPPGTPGVK